MSLEVECVHSVDLSDWARLGSTNTAVPGFRPVLGTFDPQPGSAGLDRLRRSNVACACSNTLAGGLASQRHRKVRHRNVRHRKESDTEKSKVQHRRTPKRVGSDTEMRKVTSCDERHEKCDTENNWRRTHATLLRVRAEYPKVPRKQDSGANESLRQDSFPIPSNK